MDKLEQQYDYIVEKFGKNKIVKRAEWLYKLVEDYLQSNELEGKVGISRDILKYVLVDYFVDIDRLKEFAHIDKVNDSKIYAYTAYWLLRHKPLQVLQLDNALDLTFVNENFVAHLLRSFLFSNPDDTPILDNKREDVDLFVSTLLYYFKYREYSAQSIELAILAFNAGRGYQYSVDFDYEA